MNRYFLVFAILFAPVIASAQTPAPTYLDPADHPRPVPLNGADFCFAQDHASTAAEGYLRGSAAWLHSLGNYRVNERQAALLHEFVRHQQLINRHRIAEWNDWKRLRRERRIEAKREANLEARVARYRAAYELDGSNLDRSTGEIHWPAALLACEYQASRARLEDLFRRQTGYDCPVPGEAEVIAAECDRLIRDSNRNRARIAKCDHSTAQQFLRGLKYEPLFRLQVN